MAGSEEPIQASTPSQGTGAVEVLTLDSSVLVSESKVFGAALLQGRGAGDHSGTEIEVFRDGQPLQSVLMTSGDGAFSADAEYRRLPARGQAPRLAPRG